MKRILDWLDHRTGVRKLAHEALYENVPGGSRWRYVWGSTLTFALAVQFITGLFLWMSYSPSSQTAWESVFYIQNQMSGGWLLRGLHHFTAQVMTVLLVLHLMQVVIDGAYKAPREVNFWFGLMLLVLVLALSLTGYLLPWDQKGFWATKVTTNLAGIAPGLGPAGMVLPFAFPVPQVLSRSARNLGSDHHPRVGPDCHFSDAGPRSLEIGPLFQPRPALLAFGRDGLAHLPRQRAGSQRCRFP